MTPNNVGFNFDKWVVQHESDYDPTYVVNICNDPDGDKAIELPASIDIEKRLLIAKKIAHYLNIHCISVC